MLDTQCHVPEAKHITENPERYVELFNTMYLQLNTELILTYNKGASDN